MKWIMNRLSEPSSWGAIGLVLIGCGIIFSITEIIMIGVGCGILGLILSEEAKK
jgi:hypothetical protein